MDTYYSVTTTTTKKLQPSLTGQTCLWQKKNHLLNFYTHSDISENQQQEITQNLKYLDAGNSY